ncbi:MAG: hypothetical protein ACREDR_48920, partial [Blastocatellia bacterium]
TLDTLDELAGPVPATMMRLAADRKLTICLNMDGEHVDHQIARRAIELVGAESIIVMTDRCDVPRLGGQILTHHDETGLWYQEQGVVAAGSRPIHLQITYLRSMGVAEAEITQLATLTPATALGIAPSPLATSGDTEPPSLRQNPC